MIEEYKKQHESVIGNRRIYEINVLVSFRKGEILPKLAKKLESFIKGEKGLVLDVVKEQEGGEKQVGNFWSEKRRLAYPVDKDRTGYYLTFWCAMGQEKMIEFTRMMKLEEDILRFLVVGEEDIVKLSPLPEAQLVQLLSKTGETQASVPAKEEPVKTPKSAEESLREEITLEESAAKPLPKVKPVSLKSQEDLVEKKVAASKKSLQSVEEKNSEKTVKETLEKGTEETKKEKMKESIEGREKEEIEKSVDALEKAETLEKEASKEEEKDELEKMAEVVSKEKKEKAEKQEEKKEAKEKKDEKDKATKQQKVSLEELDKKLDDLLNEDLI